MTEEELLKKFQRFVARGNKAMAAMRMDISISYVNDLILGRRPIACPAVLKLFGLKKDVTISISKKGLTK